MLFLFTYLKLTIWTGIYYFRPSNLIFDIITNNIKKSGPVLIKLIQWTLPKIEFMYDISGNNRILFEKLEELYENCDFHSLSYTEKIYRKDFHTELKDDFIEIQELASGSIGQVYKLKDNKNNEYALKILHPDINTQIYFFMIIFTIIQWIKPLHNIVNYYFPVDLYSFIKDFQMQSDFINEANNNLKFYQMYENNPCIIIPKLRKVSKNIILMDYEKGNTYNYSENSNYMNWKIVSLLKLFSKNNEAIFNFMHGDLHKGNWKVRKENKDIKLIIYDFGFCWKLPKMINDNLVFLNHVFMSINICQYTKTIDKKHIENLSKICRIFTENRASKDIIYEEIEKLKEDGNTSYTDSLFFIKLTLSVCRRVNITLDSYVLACIISHNQLAGLFKLLVDDNLKNDKEYNERYVYFQYFSDLINFCETNNIFLDYLDHLKNEFKTEKKIRNIKFDRLFAVNEEIEKNDIIKKLCIPVVSPID